MKKIPYTLILMVIVLSMFISGCTLKASKGIDAPTADVTAEVPFPVGESQGRTTELAVSSTQTAAAVGEGNQTSGDAVVEPTAEPVVNTPEPTKAPVVVATATPGTPGTYVLQQGEHPYCIARRFNVNPNDLISLNGITGSVSPGTSIKIPSNSVWPNNFARALKAHPATYTVITGDTIYSIACEFGDVDPNAIIAANNLSSPYTLTAGTSIQIP